MFILHNNFFYDAIDDFKQASLCSRNPFTHHHCIGTRIILTTPSWNQKLGSITLGPQHDLSFSKASRQISIVYWWRNNWPARLFEERARTRHLWSCTSFVEVDRLPRSHSFGNNYGNVIITDYGWADKPTSTCPDSEAIITWETGSDFANAETEKAL